MSPSTRMRLPGGTVRVSSLNHCTLARMLSGLALYASLTQCTSLRSTTSIRIFGSLQDLQAPHDGVGVHAQGHATAAAAPAFRA